MKKNRKIFYISTFIILVALLGIITSPVIRKSIYYICLPRPVLTENQVITYMKENGGLMNNSSREVIKAVQWYLYKNNKEVALQIFRNLPNEVEPISVKSNKFYGIEISKESLLSLHAIMTECFL